MEDVNKCYTKYGPDWIYRKYKKSRIILRVEVDISYRIKEHKKGLIKDLKKQIKSLNKVNTNVTRIRSVKKTGRKTDG
jgi:hypothetical protein